MVSVCEYGVWKNGRHFFLVEFGSVLIALIILNRDSLSLIRVIYPYGIDLDLSSYLNTPACNIQGTTGRMRFHCWKRWTQIQIWPWLSSHQFSQPSLRSTSYSEIVSKLSNAVTCSYYYVLISQIMLSSCSTVCILHVLRNAARDKTYSSSGCIDQHEGPNEFPMLPLSCTCSTTTLCHIWTYWLLTLKYSHHCTAEDNEQQVETANLTKAEFEQVRYIDKIYW